MNLPAEIRNHLNVGLPPEATEADVRNLLDELGPPEDIVAAAGPVHPMPGVVPVKCSHLCFW